MNLEANNQPPSSYDGSPSMFDVLDQDSTPESGTPEDGRKSVQLFPGFSRKVRLAMTV